MDTAKIKELAEAVAKMLASFDVLFRVPKGHELVLREGAHVGFLEPYLDMLVSIQNELQQLSEDTSSAGRYVQALGESPDSIDFLNHLIRGGKGRTFADILAECIWEAIRERLPVDVSPEETVTDPAVVHVVAHGARLFEYGVWIPTTYLALVKELAPAQSEAALPRLDPTDLGSLEEDAAALDLPDGRITVERLARIRQRMAARDIFSASRTFRSVGDRIVPAPVGEIRRLQDFYGYKAERRFFTDYFSAFADGQRVQPLLLSGLPGLGKTHLTIAYTLSFPELILINAEQEQLEDPLEALISKLGHHSYRRFVLFFDDVEPEHVDWSTFRHQVGGYLAYPYNVAIVIASNFEFSDRVRSRCKVFHLHPMSPEVCQELIADYLDKAKGIRCDDSDLGTALVSTVAAEYVNEFRLAKINELTPRSLVHFFEILDASPSMLKRLMSEATTGVTRRPDEEVFRDHNKRMMELIEKGLLP